MRRKISRRRRRTGEVESDTEGSAELVVARVALSDRGARIVDTGRDTKATELLSCRRSQTEGKSVTVVIHARLTTVREFRRRTNFTNETLELGVTRDRNDENLDGSDGRRKGQDTTLDVLGTSPVRVLKEGVEDATDTEGGFDDVGNKLADYREGTELCERKREGRENEKGDVPASRMVVGVTVKTLAGTS